MLLPLHTDQQQRPVIADIKDAASTSAHLRRMELLAIWGFWMLIALLMSLNTLMSPGAYSSSSSSTLLPPLIGGGVEAITWAILTPFIFKLAQRFSLDHPHWPLRLVGMVLIGAATSIVMFKSMALFRSADYEWFAHRTAGHVGSNPMENRDFTIKLWQFFEFAVYLLILAAGIAKDYLMRYRAARDRCARTRVELAQARLRTLQDQLNPHFLFNTLNGISSLVVRDPERAQDLLAQLSDLLRDTLDSKDLEVPLEKELAFVGRYSDIMRTRFGDRLTIEQRIDPQVLNAIVPNLILQPLIENAIKHGVTKLEGTGHIVITADRQENTLQLCVIDNGDSMNDAVTSQRINTGIGLRNTQERLLQAYGKQQSLRLEHITAGGTKAEIHLPFRTVNSVETSA